MMTNRSSSKKQNRKKSLLWLRCEHRVAWIQFLLISCQRKSPCLVSVLTVIFSIKSLEVLKRNFDLWSPCDELSGSLNEESAMTQLRSSKSRPNAALQPWKIFRVNLFFLRSVHCLHWLQAIRQALFKDKKNASQIFVTLDKWEINPWTVIQYLSFMAQLLVSHLSRVTKVLLAFLLFYKQTLAVLVEINISNELLGIGQLQ